MDCDAHGAGAVAWVDQRHKDVLFETYETYLLRASRDPLKHVSIVWQVVALEAVRGVLDDIYMIARGYAAPVYAGFIVLHLIIIATGIACVRRAQAGPSGTQSAGYGSRNAGTRPET